MRLHSFGLVVAIGFLLLVSLSVTAALAALNAWLFDLSPATPALWNAASTLVSLVVTTGLFALLFRFLPDVRLRWRDVTTGAAVTAVLFTIGQQVIGLYPRPEQHRLELRRRGFDDDPAAVGVLLVPDPAVRGGVHPRPCAASWRKGQAGVVRGQGSPRGESKIGAGARIEKLADGRETRPHQQAVAELQKRSAPAPTADDHRLPTLRRRSGSPRARSRGANTKRGSRWNPGLVVVRARTCSVTASLLKRVVNGHARDRLARVDPQVAEQALCNLVFATRRRRRGRRSRRSSRPSLSLVQWGTKSHMLDLSVRVRPRCCRDGRALHHRSTGHRLYLWLRAASPRATAPRVR